MAHETINFVVSLRFNPLALFNTKTKARFSDTSAILLCRNFSISSLLELQEVIKDFCVTNLVNYQPSID